MKNIRFSLQCLLQKKLTRKKKIISDESVSWKWCHFELAELLNTNVIPRIDGWSIMSHLFVNFNGLLVLFQLCSVGCYFQKALVCWAKRGKTETSLSAHSQKIKRSPSTKMPWTCSLKQLITWWILLLCNNLQPVHNERWPGKKGQTVIQLTHHFHLFVFFVWVLYCLMLK